MRGMTHGLVTMVLALTALIMLGGWDATATAADKAPAVQPSVDKGPKVIIKTKLGEIEIKLFPDKAPKHVENFIKLAKSGFYNGTIFHRVIPGFMIQGGDPNTKDLNKKELYGMGGPGHSVKAEFNDVPHKRGIVSMARSNDPDSAGSQFFIVVEDSPFLDGKYTAFGQVVKGLGVADKIVNQPRDARDNPAERIEMTVTVVE
ncbi:MAG TPA: peptidylprolyl isomerase [Nitrospiraceae bacterium]|nr:peptidylprolyl isomerase [Nitrospiraceae bacterium]